MRNPSKKQLVSLGLGAVLLVCLFSTQRLTRVPATDYERDLARMQAQLAELRRELAAEALPAEGLARLAALAFQRAALTANFIDLREAEAAITEALARVGPSEDLLLLQAHFELEVHRVERAQTVLARLAPDDEEPRLLALRSDVDEQRGRYESARSGYERVLEAEPTWDRLARLAHFQAGREGGAAADALYVRAEDEITAKEMRSYAWVELQRGRIDFDEGRVEAALAHYQQADRAYSGYWMVHKHLAEALVSLGRADEAMDLLRDLVERTGDPEFVCALASIVERSDPARGQELHRSEAALFEARRALYPEAAIGHYLRCAIRHGDCSRALVADAEQNLAQRPNADSKALLAEVCLAAGEVERARSLAAELRDSPWRSPAIRKLEERIAAQGEGRLDRSP